MRAVRLLAALLVLLVVGPAPALQAQEDVPALPLPSVPAGTSSLSLTGDAVSQLRGGTETYSEVDALFRLRQRGPEVEFEVFDDPFSSSAASVRLAAGGAEPLRVGVYRGAQAFPESGPRLDVRPRRGPDCNGTGTFRVLDVAYDEGVVTRLHVLVEERCSYGLGTVFGELRYAVPDDPAPQAVPGRVVWPATYPGRVAPRVPVRLVNDGQEPVAFTAPRLLGPDADAVSVVSTTCAQPVPPGATCRVLLEFAPLRAGAHDAELVVDRSSASALRVPLHGTGIAGTTSWRSVSEPGDLVGHGSPTAWDATVARFVVEEQDGGLRFHVSRGGARFSGRFLPPTGQRLRVGTTYTGAGRYGGGAPVLEVFSVHGCETRGSFTVHELTRDAEGLASASVTFDQECRDAAGALRGSLAYRAVRAEPVPQTRLSAGVNRPTITYGDTVRVAGRLADSRGRRVAGQPVVLESSPYGSLHGWTPMARTTTGPDGRYAVLVRPSLTRFLRARVEGDGTLVRTTIPVTGVVVRARVGLRVAGPVLPGRSVGLQGSVAPRGVRTVRLQVRQAAADGRQVWHTLGTRPTDALGAVRWTVRGPVGGTPAVHRMVVDAGRYVAGGQSGEISLRSMWAALG